MRLVCAKWNGKTLLKRHSNIIYERSVSIKQSNGLLLFKTCKTLWGSSAPQHHCHEMFSFHRKVYFGLIDIYEFKQFQFCPRSTCDINVACLQLDKSQVLTFYDGGFRNWVYTRRRRCWCMQCACTAQWCTLECIPAAI